MCTGERTTQICQSSQVWENYRCFKFTVEQAPHLKRTERKDRINLCKDKSPWSGTGRGWCLTETMRGEWVHHRKGLAYFSMQTTNTTPRVAPPQTWGRPRKKSKKELVSRGKRMEADKTNSTRLRTNMSRHLWQATGRATSFQGSYLESSSLWNAMQRESK